MLVEKQSVEKQSAEKQGASGIEHLEGILMVSAAQRSEAGEKDVNEDSLGIRIPQQPVLTTKGIASVIADGVSAADAGKMASETCVQNFLSDYYSTPDSWTVKTSAQKILTALNRWLYAQGQCYIDAQKGFITTFSALVVKSQTAHIFHVGDTRIYLYREGVLEQITKDHTAYVSPGQPYLARAMGIDISIDIDYRSLLVQKGDLFILSSDGVHDFIRQKAMRLLIEAHVADSQGLCDALIHAALEAKSHDNLSVQVLRIENIPEGDSDDAYRKLSELPFPPLLEKGMVIDGYKILKELHASSRSQLYLAEDQETKQKLVMKTPSANYSDDPAYIERLIMEEWVGSRINSAYVAHVIRPLRSRKFLYYLVEYVPGETLECWMKQHKHPSISEVIRLVGQIVKGLRGFHRKETLHQDLKPSNIMLDDDGNIKLVDFGSVYIAGIHEINSPIERDQILGTDDYAAPEYKLGRKTGPNSDMFSLAMIAYELMAGRMPFGDHYARCQQVRDYANLTYTPAFRYNPMVPNWVDGALQKALSINSELRYESFSEFLLDLEKPNPDFLDKSQLPLLERDPLSFWKGLSGVLMVSVMALLYIIFSLMPA